MTEIYQGNDLLTAVGPGEISQTNSVYAAFAAQDDKLRFDKM